MTHTYTHACPDTETGWIRHAHKYSSHSCGDEAYTYLKLCDKRLTTYRIVLQFNSSCANYLHAFLTDLQLAIKLQVH